MESIELKNRTTRFSVSIIDLIEKLPSDIAPRVVANQIVRSATSVGANYRAVCRARSDKEFIAKMSIVAEESDETLYWRELMGLMNWIPAQELEPVIKEANELTSIFVKSLKTIKTRLRGYS